MFGFTFEITVELQPVILPQKYVSAKTDEFWRNVICSDIKADAGCLTETACVTHGDPGGTGVKSYC